MPNDLISREAAKRMIEVIREMWLESGRERDAYCAGYISEFIDALPAADAGNRLAPEPLKAALRESLKGCGPMAVVYAEATVNAMAGIESPKAITATRIDVPPHLAEAQRVVIARAAQPQEGE